MIIFKNVTECDVTNTKYDSPVAGIAYLARGATGRVCEVLGGGSEELARLQERGDEILTAAQARERVEADPQSYSDF